MKHEGRGVIRMNDKTDHGGQVISVSSGTKVMGVEAALHADMTFCPQCKGTFPIKAAGEGAKHDGRPYAYDGDSTACGAKLIASLPW
ncbi:PAAR domain-containing protein [Pseudoduganella sp.]|uniref:PAAR domain-containing protein n=1 Tax=Pseudoduganella sp. TaxID=1880898 RepID=UPI0035B12E89